MENTISYSYLSEQSISTHCCDLCYCNLDLKLTTGKIQGGPRDARYTVDPADEKNEHFTAEKVIRIAQSHHLCQRCLEVSWGPAIWQAFNSLNMTLVRYDEMEYDVALADLRSGARNGCCWCTLLLESLLGSIQISDLPLSRRIWLHFRPVPKGFWPPRMHMVAVNISGNDDEHVPEIILGALPGLVNTPILSSVLAFTNLLCAQKALLRILFCRYRDTKPRLPASTFTDVECGSSCVEMVTKTAQMVASLILQLVF